VPIRCRVSTTDWGNLAEALSQVKQAGRPTRMAYRPEIDGLRAIAVLIVVIFHAGFTRFGGGYVGVDVFFVISGFLITGLIRREVIHTGGFSFSSFYYRRIRRLFPALVSTTVFSGLVSLLLLSPSQMKSFAASAVASTLSLSNVYFCATDDYFDAAAITKPLLHTWSLSVEEQFYLLWPSFLVFVVLRRKRNVALGILASVCVFGLAIAEYWIAVFGNVPRSGVAPHGATQATWW
jgi:peptidoglycan/LPS O-acetylase OafA/YrhL